MIVGHTQLALQGLDWLADLGAPADLLARARSELGGGAARRGKGPAREEQAHASPPVPQQPVLPAYGEGADDWDHIADEIKVPTDYGDLVYVKLQAHNVAPLINQLSKVLLSAEAESAAMKTKG